VVAYVTVVGARETSQDLAEELRQHVGKRIGKFARPHRVAVGDQVDHHADQHPQETSTMVH
jgi:acyl-coenzyme A synthetase/AMP-(fatty) acid ligase